MTALRQAELYLPRQAAALQLVYCGDIYSCYGRSKRAAVDKGEKEQVTLPLLFFFDLKIVYFKVKKTLQ